jgi:hypothetical protein
MAEQEKPFNHLEFMANPMRWPGLVLPVKNRKNFKLGVMFDERPRIYLVNMYELAQYQGRAIEDIPHVDYPDLLGVVDDGWVVD